jgi:2-polyprenyl-3-methyl-5-hydroxy-6-metoxy-1,4-benzoquinol methylase
MSEAGVVVLQQICLNFDVAFSRRRDISYGHKLCEAMKHSVESWLSELSQADGIYLLSKDRPFGHPEQEYDKHIVSQVEPTIGHLVLSRARRAPQNILEIGCGTGYLTSSLIHAGGMTTLVASDPSTKFLHLTRQKVQTLPQSGKLRLLRLADCDLDCIPSELFDFIVMRSVLHHFEDFKSAAALLLSKLPPGGQCFMLEPRADFHITASLLLKMAKANALARRDGWSTQHEKVVRDFVEAAEFYSDRGRDKSGSEDKYAFFVEELLGISEDTGTVLSSIGGEYQTTYSQGFKDFLFYCMNCPQQIVQEIAALLSDELAFMDRTHSARPRYYPAEWFAFTRPE